MTTGLSASELNLETLLARYIQLAEELQQRDLQLLQLSQELAQFKKLVFGSKSERFQPQDKSQLALAWGDEPAPTANPLPTQQITYERQQSGKSKHAGRMPLPAHLPRKQLVLEPEGVDTSLWKRNRPGDNRRA